MDASSDAQGRPAPGGTCTNVGCIPSKALLQSSEHYEQLHHGLAAHGITVDGARMDVPRMLARKDKVVRQNNEGIAHLFKKNGVRFVHGHARLAGQAKEAWKVEVRGLGEEPDARFTARHVLIATGSSPRALPGLPFDEQRILSNTGALRLSVVPRKLGVIGAGVIGLELGSVWRRLGAEVTVLEVMPEFLAMVDESVAAEARKALERQGLKIVLGARIGEVLSSRLGVSVNYTDAQGAAQVLGVDQLIVAIGRVPHTQGLQADAVGLALDAGGAIRVDDECRTNLDGVWAVGDVVRGPMLAHKAEEEGVAVAERIAGQRRLVRLDTIPSVIYTHPEVAWVGQTEPQLKAAGVPYKTGSFPFLANGRARALGDTTGLVKVLAHADTDAMLGVHIVGPQASELIAEAVLALENGLRAEALADACHAHPTLSEALKEAALDVHQRRLNL